MVRRRRSSETTEPWKDPRQEGEVGVPPTQGRMTREGHGSLDEQTAMEDENGIPRIAWSGSP